MCPDRGQHPAAARGHRDQPRLPRRGVLNDLGVDEADIKRQLHCYVNVPRTPFGRRPRRKRRPDDISARCSFCGKPGSDERRLVAGPDVWICADCVTLCGEILAQPAGAGSA
ncbi:ClpX C4-type zinc finger protein [Streptomyces mirabilis]|uniref:ClpX C4-type zinc finger protein n=1 Tax=Streptomyces mirabilis TaxID=68239 RepID=UPI003680A1C2